MIWILYDMQEKKQSLLQKTDEYNKASFLHKERSKMFDIWIEFDWSIVFIFAVWEKCYEESSVWVDIPVC
jgi:hypothetical protein